MVLPTGLTGGTQKTPKTLIQTVNLNQTTTKIDETWGIASPLPREHIPKRSRPKDQQILRIMGEIKRDWGFLKHSRTSIQKSRDSRGSRTGLEAWESQQRTRSLLAIKCTKNEIEIHHTRAQNEEMGLIQKAQRALGG